MPFKNLFKNSYFYLFLGCMATLGSLGITLCMAEKANSERLSEAFPAISQDLER